MNNANWQQANVQLSQPQGLHNNNLIAPNNNSNLDNSNNFQKGYQVAGATTQALSYPTSATIISSQQPQPFVYQPPNQLATGAQTDSIGGDQVILNDPYNIPADQLVQQQQQQHHHQQLISNQQQQQLQSRRLLDGQKAQVFRHPHLHHQRSLPLPPPLLQQIQARQQQQQSQRHYYQAANKLLFDDPRYYSNDQLLVDQDPRSYRAQFQRLRRHGYNLESTRGLNQSLQSQWLYGGSGQRSMATDLLLGSQASILGDAALESDQKIVNDFRLLHEESRQLFNGLR